MSTSIIHEAFIRRLDAALDERGMKDADLARALGSSTYINKLRKRGAVPGTQKLIEIAEVLGLPTWQLLPELVPPPEARADDGLTVDADPDAFDASVGRRIKALREAKDLTQAQLGALVGAAQSTVGDWEAGNHEPRRSVIPRIAKALSVSSEFLEFGGDADGESLAGHSFNPHLLALVLRAALAHWNYDLPRQAQEFADEVAVLYAAAIDDGLDEESEQQIGFAAKTLARRSKAPMRSSRPQ